MLLQQPHHGEREPGRDQRRAAHLHVTAVHDRGDGRGVRGGPPDPQFIQGLHEGGLCVAGGWRGGVPVRGDLGGVQGVTLGHHGQPLVLGLLGLLRVLMGEIRVHVPALLVRGQEPPEGDDGPGSRELGVGPGMLTGGGGGRGAQADGRGAALGVLHLGGHGALPDQLVELELVHGQLRAHLRRGAEGVPRGAHGLVGLLRVLGLGRVHALGGGDELCAVELLGLRARGVDRLIGQRDRVGTHVRDVAVLVQPLRDPHGGARGETQLASGLLLQRGGGERCGGTACVGLGLERTDRELGVLQSGRERRGHGLVQRGGGVLPGGLELAAVREVLAGGHAAAVQGAQPGGEGPPSVLPLGPGEGAGEVPVVGGHERDPLPFALDHQAGGHGLHAPGGEPRGDLAPQHRGDLVAVEPVQDAAGLLGVHEVLVDLPQLREPALDGLPGDLRERQAVHGDLGLEHLQQVPRDRLTLAITIRGQVQGVRVLELALELRDLLLLVRVDHVVRVELVLHVHRELAVRALLHVRRQLGGLRQVTDVAHGGLHFIGVPQVPRDRLHLGR